MTTSIQAAVCREFGAPLTIETLDLADPRPGEVQLRVVASAICHSDIHFFEGAWGGKLPAVWGHEAAGVVEAVGDGVTDVEPGDHVVATLIRSCGTCANCAKGASVACVGTLETRPTPLTDASGTPVGHGLGTACFAERANIDRSQIVIIDKDLDMAAASLLACGVITGVGAALNATDISSGDVVVVIGTGGVGLNAVQGAKLAGASAIIAVDLSDDKLAAAETFGATHTINSGTTDLRDEVKRVTNGAMADHVLVTVGAQGPIEQAPTLLAPNGAVVIVGMPARGVTATIDPVTLAAANQRIIGTKMGQSTISDDIPRLIGHHRSGSLKLQELITRTWHLDEINEAISEVTAGRAVRNVIMFDELNS